ncbi:MAG TPA: hypothetical protein VNU92_08950 [Edaphobacter sp.]|jgi:hypothetical protein|nr:hypothetical protein [Edaphobacter sp.]
MKPCPHDSEIKAMLLQGHWPDACNPELRAHIEACPQCHQQVLLTHTFQTARAQAIESATIPHPALLWWKAQLLRRNAAIRQVERPFTTAQIFAFVVSGAAAATLLIHQSQTDSNWLAWLSAPWQDLRVDTTSFFASTQANLTSTPGLILLGAAAGTLLLLGSVIAYLASDRQ